MNIAIVGAGKMGACHARVYKKLGIIPIIISRNAEKARELAEGGKILASLEELLPGEVDAIDICLPTHLHKDAILRAAELAPNIICEKPLCLGMDEFKEIEAAIQEKETNLMVAQVVRFWDSHLAVQNAARAKIKGITCMRRQRKPIWSEGDWLFDRSKSGGIIYDLAIHDIDFIVNWLGMPKAVSAFQNEQNSTVMLDYGDFAANISASWGLPSTYNRGEVETFFEAFTEERLIVFDSNASIKSIEMYGKTFRERWNFDSYDAYEKQLEYFTSCIRDKKAAEKSNLQSIKNTMEVMEMCRR